MEVLEVEMDELADPDNEMPVEKRERERDRVEQTSRGCTEYMRRLHARTISMGNVRRSIDRRGIQTAAWIEEWKH